MSKPTQNRSSKVTANRANTAKPTKQAAVIELLRAPSGTTIEAMMQSTGWQQHSVRGFLAGVIRKKLKLKLSSAKIDGNRIYRINGDGNSKSSGSRPRRRAT